MGNTISDLTPTPLPAATTATSFNRNGKYIIQSTLGIGTHGIVYRVNHLQSNKILAMKVLQTSTSTQLRRFREEATLLASLSHLNIVALEDIAGVPCPETAIWNACIVTELADSNLFELYTSYTSLRISGIEEAIAQSVAFQLLSALVYLHEQGLVHRDIKPSNILVFLNEIRSSLLFKLADFGLAVHLQHDDGNMPTGAVARYTAPEWFLDTLPPDSAAKADIWALGQLCRDLCTQAFVFPHTEGRLMGAWAKETVEWMRRVDVQTRPTARECREAVWVRQGERIPSGVLRALREELGMLSSGIDEMEE